MASIFLNPYAIKEKYAASFLTNHAFYNERTFEKEDVDSIIEEPKVTFKRVIIKWWSLFFHDAAELNPPNTPLLKKKSLNGSL